MLRTTRPKESMLSFFQTLDINEENLAFYKRLLDLPHPVFVIATNAVMDGLDVSLLTDKKLSDLINSEGRDLIKKERKPEEIFKDNVAIEKIEDLNPTSSLALALSSLKIDGSIIPGQDLMVSKENSELRKLISLKTDNHEEVPNLILNTSQTIPLEDSLDLKRRRGKVDKLRDEVEELRNQVEENAENPFLSNKLRKTEARLHTEETNLKREISK